MVRAFHAQDRAVLRISGRDARGFLQDLVTNDLSKLDEGMVYAALLSPQGKYLFDFLIAPWAEAMLLDVKADRAEALARRLAMYRLRAAVEIAPTDLAVVVLLDAPVEGALADPRDPALGWRSYVPDPGPLLAGRDPVAPVEWDALRIERGVPETGIELVPDETYPLAAGFERLHGVDFRKGCYVGQEVTARMKHKTELRKGLAQVEVAGAAPPPGTAITSDGRAVGTLFTTARGRGLAHLRFERAGGEMRAGAARISLRERVS
jgi:tRNA-modifying protein YgfZ